IGLEALVPIVRRHVLDRHPVIVAGVVDQDPNRADPLRERADGRAKRTDVAQVHRLVMRSAAGSRFDMPGGLFRIIRVQVDEADTGPLRAEMFHERGADSGSAAGDQHALAFEARIDRAVHGHFWNEFLMHAHAAFLAIGLAETSVRPSAENTCTASGLTNTPTGSPCRIERSPSRRTTIISSAPSRDT